jgi:hypothetical protein
MADAVLDKLLNALSDFSDDELKSLARILEYPPGRRSLATVVRGLIGFREASRLSTPPAAAALPSKVGQRELREAFLAQVSPSLPEQEVTDDRLKRFFFRALDNRKALPSTRDVVDTMNRSFGCELEYERFRRKGRLAAMTKCWRHLLRLKKARRLSLLRSFFERVPSEDASSDAYRELFRILTSNE